MDILASEQQQISGEKQFALQHHYFIETINKVYAQSQSRSIRKSFSAAFKQRFSKCAAVNRSLLRRDDRFASPLAGMGEDGRAVALEPMT
jgi:hypothetical protein